MAGFLQETLSLKAYSQDISGNLYTPGNTLIYALSGGVYALNEFNVKVRLDNITGGSTVGKLDDLTDVIITTPISGDFLSFDGTFWRNKQLVVSQNGKVNCSTGISIYTINHSGVDINSSYPMVSLETPATSSTLYVQAITQRTSGSFQVVLSGLPVNNNYKINWMLGASNTSVQSISHELIPLTYSISTYPYFIDLNYVPIKYVPNNIVGNIKSWEVIAENGTPCSVDIDVWYNTTTLPTSANSIDVGNHPRLVSQNQAKDTTVSGWSTAINNGYFGFQVNSVSACQGFTLQILLEKV